ncbi:MAG: hypothetical protein ACFFF4_11160 [Candidatus Thorarchaeota archaeon]
MSRVQTIRGRAENAKGGAVVITDSLGVIYIDGVDSWDDNVVGRDVEVKGEIFHGKHIPDPVVDEDGAISTGAAGIQTILLNPKWKLK